MQWWVERVFFLTPGQIAWRKRFDCPYLSIHAICNKVPQPFQKSVCGSKHKLELEYVFAFPRNDSCSLWIGASLWQKVISNICRLMSFLGLSNRRLVCDSILKLLLFPGKLEANFLTNFRRNVSRVPTSITSLLSSLIPYLQWAIKGFLTFLFLNQHDLLISQKCSVIKFYHS